MNVAMPRSGGPWIATDPKPVRGLYRNTVSNSRNLYNEYLFVASQMVNVHFFHPRDFLLIQNRWETLFSILGTLMPPVLIKR